MRQESFIVRREVRFWQEGCSRKGDGLTLGGGQNHHGNLER